jgi:hypothetical protein
MTTRASNRIEMAREQLDLATTLFPKTKSYLTNEWTSILEERRWKHRERSKP